METHFNNPSTTIKNNGDENTEDSIEEYNALEEIAKRKIALNAYCSGRRRGLMSPSFRVKK